MLHQPLFPSIHMRGSSKSTLIRTFRNSIVSSLPSFSKRAPSSSAPFNCNPHNIAMQPSSLWINTTLCLSSSRSRHAELPGVDFYIGNTSCTSTIKQRVRLFFTLPLFSFLNVIHLWPTLMGNSSRGVNPHCGLLTSLCVVHVGVHDIQQRAWDGMKHIEDCRYLPVRDGVDLDDTNSFLGTLRFGYLRGSL
jgi:hypothetical protein